MSLATFSYIIGVFELLIGIPALLHPDKTIKWVLHVLKSDVYVRTMGAVFLVLSVLVLLENAEIGSDVAGLIVLMAWITAVKSIGVCWWPAWWIGIAERMYAKPAFRSFGVLAVGIGILFLMAGNALS